MDRPLTADAPLHGLLTIFGAPGLLWIVIIGLALCTALSIQRRAYIWAIGFTIAGVLMFFGFAEVLIK